MKFVSNCYNLPPRLFRGGSEIKSQEGTRQGDTIAVDLYAPGITLLLSKSISSNSGSISTDKLRQIRFADDFAGCGQPTDLRKCFDELSTLCLLIGYYVKPSKSWVIVKEEPRKC